MKRKYISFILFILGLSIIAYPWVTRPFDVLEENKAIEEYYSMAEDLSPEVIEEYEKYNGILALEDKKEYDDRLLGTIEIPKFKLEIPIYQGATVKNLKKGIGHVAGTSLPTGELGTHSVLAGHSRYRNKSLFTEIHKLEVGDSFNLDILGKKMEYEVAETMVVEPHEINYLLPVEGKDKLPSFPRRSSSDL